MQYLANENNPLRLDIEGGEVYLPFAKNKLREMKRLMTMRGISIDNRVIDAGDAEILVKSIPGMDYIRITGKAKARILLIYIRDTSTEPDAYGYELVYVTAGEDSGRDYRALLYKYDDSSDDEAALTPDGMMGDGLTISDTGLTLNIQSGAGVYAAELPSIYVYNDTIDNAEFMKTSWSSTLVVLYQQRIVGSHYVSNWTKTQVNGKDKFIEDAAQLMRISGSRHPYTTDSDGYINACMFKNQQTLLGTGVMYRELTLFPDEEFYQLWKNEIAYKSTPQDSSYVTSKLIGSDYITGTPWQTGYSWKTHQVIDVFDKDNALVKIESNKIIRGGNVQHPFTLNLEVTNRWYLDSTPPVFFTTSDTWVYNGQTAIFDVLCKRTERLMVGEMEIEETQYEESRYDSNRLDWIPGAIPGMTLVSHSGDAHGGFGDGAVSASGGMTGPGKFNAALKVEEFLNTATGRNNVRMWPISVGERHEAGKEGYRDIHVMAFDNMDGANNFIIIYQKSYVYFMESSDTPTVNDGTIPDPVIRHISNPTVTTYYIVYRIKNSGLIKKTLSGAIRAASCQINNGYMAYTYCSFHNDTFSSRTIGMVDIETGGQQEWQIDDKDDRLSGFQHLHHAAIGIL
ncbi:MAG: hypothetical protein H7843_11645 [Nitrospirota bacterium]